VSTTPAINLCHGFSVIGGVVVTSDKFFAGINDTGKQLSPVLLLPTITFSPGVVYTGQKYPKSLKLSPPRNFSPFNTL
jgi:hypothetical protein